jgi:hypothetical protein
VLLGALPLAPACRDVQRVGAQRDRNALVVDDQQFFLDTDGPHRSMLTSSGRYRRIEASPAMRCPATQFGRYP